VNVVTMLMRQNSLMDATGKIFAIRSQLNVSCIHALFLDQRQSAE